MLANTVKIFDGNKYCSSKVWPDQFVYYTYTMKIQMFILSSPRLFSTSLCF